MKAVLIASLFIQIIVYKLASFFLLFLIIYGGRNFHHRVVYYFQTRKNNIKIHNVLYILTIDKSILQTVVRQYERLALPTAAVRVEMLKILLIKSTYL